MAKTPGLDQSTTQARVKSMFNKTLDINNHHQNDIIHGLETEKYISSSKDPCSGWQTKRRNFKKSWDKNRKSLETAK
jgi:hypothetical protein